MVQFWAEKTIDALYGNGFLKAYAFSMADEMVAGAFGRARNQLWVRRDCSKRKKYPTFVISCEISLVFCSTYLVLFRSKSMPSSFLPERKVSHYFMKRLDGRVFKSTLTWIGEICSPSQERDPKFSAKFQVFTCPFFVSPVALLRLPHRPVSGLS